MKKVPKGKYTKEFREEAVKLVTEGGLSLPEAGLRLSLPSSTIRNWVQAFKAGKLGDLGKYQRPLTEIEMELARLGYLSLAAYEQKFYAEQQLAA